MDVDFEFRGRELKLTREVFADAVFGASAAGADLLGLGQVVFDAIVWEMIERVSLPGTFRPGTLAWVSGSDERGRFDFKSRVVEVEEMPLAGIVEESFAAGSEDIAAKSRQLLGQFGVFLLQLAVIGGGGIKHALEFSDAASGVFSLPLSVLGLLLSVLGLLLSVLGLLLSVLGLPPQLIVAAQQVEEQPLALLGVVGEMWCDAHNMNCSRAFMLFKLIIPTFSRFFGD